MINQVFGFIFIALAFILTIVSIIIFGIRIDEKSKGIIRHKRFSLLGLLVAVILILLCGTISFMSWSSTLLLMSFVLGVDALLIFLLAPRIEYKSKWHSRRKYIAIAFLLVSVTLMLGAYAVGDKEINLFDNITKVISSILGFFTLDADYMEFTKVVNETFNGGWYYLFYIEYWAYILIMPLIGGVFLLDIISTIVPAFRLLINRRNTKYVFSELNARSITLAEDIAEKSWKIRTNQSVENIDESEKFWLKRACIVFTDVYTDKESENSSELLARAKNIGAICIRNDILEVTFHWWARLKRKLVYFLMDEKEENNVTTAISLLSSSNNKIMNRAKKRWNHREYNIDMYVFSSSSESARLIDEKKTEEKTSISSNIKLLVKCVNEYRNVVFKMFDGEHNEGKTLSETFTLPGTSNDEIEKRDEALKQYATYRVWNGYFQNKDESKESNKSNVNPKHEINIVIFGGGRIAKEYIKTAVWCYKMCSSSDDTKVDKINISVFAKDADELEYKLHLEAPELFKNKELEKEELKLETVSKDKQNSNLEATNEPLKPKSKELEFDCAFNFYKATFPSKEFFDIFSDVTKLSVQKILVAFGDDELNYDAARLIKDLFEREQGIRNSHAPMSIEFAIENDDLYQVLNNQFVNNENYNSWCLLRPFSVLKNCFSYECVCLSDLENRGLEADRIYQQDKSVDEFLQTNYAWKSSVATALHSTYKWFSKVKIGDNVSGMYNAMLNGLNDDKQKELSDKVYWLEHKRWNAYMASEGYRCPSAHEFAVLAFTPAVRIKGPNNDDEKIEVAFKRRGHQDHFRRLHACMLESDGKYTKIEELFAKLGYIYSAEKKIKEAICDAQENINKEKTLSGWLNEYILYDHEEVDDLDRLSLLITLIKMRNYKKELINKVTVGETDSDPLSGVRDIVNDTDKLRLLIKKFQRENWKGSAKIELDDIKQEINGARKSKYLPRWFRNKLGRINLNRASKIMNSSRKLSLLVALIEIDGKKKDQKIKSKEVKKIIKSAKGTNYLDLFHGTDIDDTAKLCSLFELIKAENNSEDAVIKKIEDQEFKDTFNKIIDNNKATANEKKILDKYDLLSLLVTLILDSTDYKDYDIRISRGLCLQVLKKQIINLYDPSGENKKPEFTSAIKSLINAEGNNRVIKISDNLTLVRLKDFKGINVSKMKYKYPITGNHEWGIIDKKGGKNNVQAKTN